MDFTAKLDLLMKARGLSRRQFALQSGIPYTTIVNFYEKGAGGVKLSTLRKITAFFSVSLDYLTNSQIEDPDYGKAAGFCVTCPEMQLLRKYRAISPHGRDLVNTVLQKQYAYEQACGEQAPSRKEQPLIDLRHYWDAPSAGEGNPFSDGGYDLLHVEDSPAARQADFALTVSGRSMEPRFLDGDIVLVKAQETYEIGDIVVFSKNEESYIKLAGRRCFESINPAFADIPLSEDDSFRCFGIVLGKL